MKAQVKSFLAAENKIKGPTGLIEIMQITSCEFYYFLQTKAEA